MTGRAWSSTPHRSTIGCATIARLAAALLWVEGWVQRKTSPKTRRNANFEVETDSFEPEASAFYAAPHAWASGAPRPTLAVDHTRDRCPAGRTDPRHTPSEARARPAAALPVGVPLLPRVRVRPGRSFIGLYGLPRGFWIVNIWEQRGKVNDLPPKRVISCRSLRGAGLRGAEGCHRPDRRPRVRRRQGCARAPRTSPSGRTGRAPVAPAPPATAS